MSTMTEYTHFVRKQKKRVDEMFMMSAVTEYVLPVKIPVWVRVAVPAGLVLAVGGIVLVVKKKSSKKA